MLFLCCNVSDKILCASSFFVRYFSLASDLTFRVTLLAMCSFPPHKTVPTHSSNMLVSTTLASGLSILNVYVQSLGFFFFFSCSPVFSMLAIGMTTTLLLLSLTCSTQIKHICISCSAFFSPYLDSFQRSLENVILCSTSLRLARPLLSVRVGVLPSANHATSRRLFIPRGGVSRRSHSEASRRSRRYGDWDVGGASRMGVA